MSVKPYTMGELERWAEEAMEQGGAYPSAKLVATVEALEDAQFMLHYYKAVNVVLEKTIETLQKEMKKEKRNVRPKAR
jgi:hypothetical protein